MFTSTKRSADRSTRARSQGGAQLAALAELTLGYFGKPLRGKEV